MRLVKKLAWLLTACAAQTPAVLGQQPVGVSAVSNPTVGIGAANFFGWYTATPSGGCVNGANGFCVGPSVQGDFYYWTAWMPDSSQLPVSTGLPVVGTINDYTFGACGGNIGILQLDAWSWAAPTASHITKINCMTSYGGSSGASNAPAGWFGHMTSSDDGSGPGTWKSRAPFSKGGILYLPVERQISSGRPGVHDASFVMSPDGGKHWCNPNTYFARTSGPGCDSSNWQADGDAPKCDAPDAAHPCTNAAYLDTTHSSMMWKALPYGTEAWNWINFGNQDGQPYPSGAGVADGCDPKVYTCFMLFVGEGSLARVPNDSIMDITAWQYYTCPTMASTGVRCPGADPASWTSTIASRTPVMALHYAYGAFGEHNSPLVIPFTVMYLKEFKSYITVGVFGNIYWAPSLTGPWKITFENGGGSNMIAPALGYTVMSTNPPHVQITATSNSYEGGQGSPQFTVWDLILGRQMGGEAFQVVDKYNFRDGDGYQFSGGNVAGSFPRKGLVWAFDFGDRGSNPAQTNWPQFIDRAGSGAVISPCNGDNYAAPAGCGSTSAGRGTSVDAYGIKTTNSEYEGTYIAFANDSLIPSSIMASPTPARLPAAMTGDGTYSVVGVYKYDGPTPFGRPAGIWSAGTGGSNNSAVNLNQVSGRLQLSWNGFSAPRYLYSTNFTMTQGNWYFVAVTVQAQGGACGTNCTPTARIWVGGASTPGKLDDVNAGIAYTAANNPTAKTPAVSAAPFMGTSPTFHGQAGALMSYATVMVYERALPSVEVQFMYRSMKAKMAARGVTLQ